MMAKNLKSLVLAAGLGLAAVGFTGCATDPGMGFQAGSVAGDYAAQRSAMNGAPGWVPWAWKAISSISGGQAEYERNAAVANEAAERARQQQEEQARQSMPRAEIQRVWEDYDIAVNNQTGMMIHTKYLVHNLQGNPIRLIAYFFDENGTKLMDKDGTYRSDEGQVSAPGESLLMPYQDSECADCTIFVPYNQFDITESGIHNLKFHVQIYNQNAGQFISVSDFEHMQYKN